MAVTVGTIETQLSADVRQFVSSMKQAQTTFQQTASSIQAQSSQASAALNSIGTSVQRLQTTFARSMAAIGAGFILPSVFRAANGAIMGFNQTLDSARISMTTFTGSAEAAEEQIKTLQQFAATTPFNFSGLLRTSQQMMAMGVQAEQLIPRLTAIGDAAAALGGSAEVMNRIQRALGQIQAKGRAQAEELLQLAEAGIPAYEYVAQLTGGDIPAALDLMKKGQIDAAGAINAILDGMARDFGGMMEMQARTLDGAISTVQDYVEMTVGAMGRPIFEAVRDVTLQVADFLGSDKAAEGAKQFAENFSNAVTSASAMIGKFIKTIGPSFVATLKAMYAAGAAFANALASMKGVLIPIGGALAGIVMAVGALASALTPVIKLFSEYNELATALGATLLILYTRKKLLSTETTGLAGALKRSAAAMTVQIQYQKTLAGMAGQSATSFQAFGASITSGMRAATVAVRGFLAAAWPMLALQGAIMAVTYAIGQFRKASEEAKKRQEVLTQEFIDAGDPATMLVDKMRDLASSIELVSGAASDAEGQVESFVGKSLLFMTLGAEDANAAFNDLGMSIEDVAGILSSGTDVYDDMQYQFNTIGELIALLNDTAGESADEGINRLNAALLALAESGEYDVNQLDALLVALDEAADAFDDHREKLEEEAKAYITAGDFAKDYSDILGDYYVNSVIASVQAGESATETLEKIHDAASGFRRDAALAREFAYAIDEIGWSAGEVLSDDQFFSALADAQIMLGLTTDRARELALELGVLDELSVETKIKLNLSVEGLDETIAAMEAALRAYDAFVSSVGMAYDDPKVAEAIRTLTQLRKIASGVERPGFMGGGGGGGGAARAVDEVAESIAQLASNVAKYGNRLMGRDFAEALFGGTRESIMDTFRDMTDSVTEMMAGQLDQSLTAFVGGMAGRFARLAALADLRQQLTDEIEAVNQSVARVGDLFATNLEGGEDARRLDYQMKVRARQARKFVENLRKIAGMGFPAAVIGDVVSAGLVNGAAMAQELSGFSPTMVAKFTADYAQLGRYKTEAQSLIRDMMGGDALELELVGTNSQMAELVSAIQNDLRGAFDSFLTGLGQEIDGLRSGVSPASLYQSPSYSTGRAADKSGAGVTVVVNAGMGTDGTQVGRQIVQVLNEYAASGGARLSSRLVG